MNERGSNHQLLKQNNHNLIKKHIYRHSPISRVEIAHQLGLTTATITGMVNPMISSGLLRETAAPAVSRKSSTLTFPIPETRRPRCCPGLPS